MSSRFMHSVAYVTIFFRFKAELYSIVCIYHVLLIHSFGDGYLGCFRILAIVNNAYITWVHKYLFETPLSILLGVYPEAELLHHMVTQFLMF